MLDRDLAELYGVETRNLNKAVSRNSKRFPEDFIFQLTDTEFKNLKFHFGTSSWGGTRKLPNVFSEQGVAMLSGVLTSDRAILVNIQIMRIFVHTRKILVDSNDFKSEIEYIKDQMNKHDAKLESHEKNIEVVFSYLDELMEKKAKPRRRIGYMPDDL